MTKNSNVTTATEAAQGDLCACKDRPKSGCPGEWEPGCDLGSNPAHVRVTQQEAPAAQPLTDEQITAFAFTDAIGLMASLAAAYRAGVRRAENAHGIQPATTKGTTRG